MKIYNVLVEYTHFEDEDCNYSEIIGSFTDKNKAIKCIEDECLKQIECDMVVSEALSDTCNDVALGQKYGYGATRIILSTNEIEDTNHLKEVIKEHLDSIIDDINNDDEEEQDNKDYVNSLTEEQKELVIGRVLNDDDVLLGIRDLLVYRLWH